MIKRLMIIVVSIILIGALVVPIINSSTHEIEKTDTNLWTYDDYKVLPNIESATGAIEKITVGETTYYHANNLGEATLTGADGHTETITVSKAKLDVYLALGQSNNSYVNAVPSEASPVPQPGTTYYYGTETTLIHSRSEDLTAGNFEDVIGSEGTPKIGDKVPSFGATYYKLTGVKTYYIDAAWMGSSIAWWQDLNSVVWTSAVTVVETAMSKIPTEYYDVTVRGYTWIQGERDASNAVDVYIQCFDTMNQRILNGDLGANVNHCFMSKVRQANAPNPSIAQIQIADSNSTVTLCTSIADTFTVANGLMASDDLHYTQKGNNIIGTKLAESCAAYYYTKEIENLKLMSVLPPVMLIGVLLIGVDLIRRRD